MRCVAWVVLMTLAFASACNEPSGSKGAPSGPHDGAGAPVATAEATPAPGPPPARPFPTITFTDRGLSVDGQDDAWDKLDQRAKTLGERKAESEGKDVAVVALRNAPAHQVAAAAQKLLEVWHPRSLTIRTPTRDQSQGELLVVPRHGHAPDCSAVVAIERDSAVDLWSKGGGGAQRFSRGMAGPDLTSSTDALKRRAGGCDSPVWFLGAADGVTWGLVFDLALRAKASEDGGTALRPMEVALLGRSPVAGRPIKDE